MFSEILKELIEDKGLSLRKLAAASNVSAVQYGKYLKGAYPNIDVAVRIANYFKCSLDYLFGISDVNKYEGEMCYNLSYFVEKYEKLLKENKITHWKFSKETGLSESCLRHWKYGQEPRMESLIIIAKNLSASLDYLVGAGNE